MTPRARTVRRARRGREDARPVQSGSTGPAARKDRYGLWVLIAGPLIFSAHFLVSYIAAALHCAKRPDVPLGDVKLLIAVLTAVALAGILATGARGLKRHLESFDGTPHDEETPQDRRSFLGFATLLLCGLSAVAVLFVAMPVLFFEVCR